MSNRYTLAQQLAHLCLEDIFTDAPECASRVEQAGKLATQILSGTNDEQRLKLREDIEGLIEYCSDEDELESFYEYVIENGTIALDAGEQEHLEEDRCNLGLDGVQEDLERVAERDLNLDHAWARAHRVSQALAELFPS